MIDVASPHCRYNYCLFDVNYALAMAFFSSYVVVLMVYRAHPTYHLTLSAYLCPIPFGCVSANADMYCRTKLSCK